MREENIAKMNFMELRSEVQLLRDELAIMKRKYEDMLYNLDNDNFSANIVLEKSNMKSEIEANAEEISTKVSREDMDGALSNYSTISQTAENIRTAVVKGVKLSDAVVTNTKPTDAAGFDKTKYYLYQNTPYYFNTISQKWEAVEGDSIFTMFQQTADGFLLKGNTVIDGETTVTRNLTLSGNVTWDMENSPVKTQYSPTGSVWHNTQQAGDMYMRMSFDGGRTWSNPTKVVGTDGVNGADGSDGQDGSDANVTPENVFNALTDSGAQQGIFAAFVNKQNKIYINAEYLATKIAEIADAVYVGDYSTGTEQKHIYFNDQANIHTFETGVGQNGIAISSNGFQVWSKPSEIKFIAPNASGFTTGSITLAEYVEEYGGGVAVFG